MKIKIQLIKDPQTAEDVGFRLRIVNDLGEDLISFPEPLIFKTRANARAWITANIIEAQS